jgi:membrane protease YdiL (CAAX protease family)
VAVFFGVAFGFSWAIGGATALLGESLPGPAKTAFWAAYMFGPALGTLAARRASGEPLLRSMEARLRPNRAWLFGWLSPWVLSIAAAGVALLLPGVDLSRDFSGIAERFSGLVPADRLGESIERLRGIPPLLLVLLMTVAPLFAGATVNALFAFGEELGWRGFLYQRWGPRGFWRSSAAIGAVWGLWHAPIILQGLNYPEHRLLGVPMMIVLCLALAPLMQHVRERGESVWAAAVCHGTFNACGGLALLYLKGGSDLLVGITGLSGLAALASMDAVIYALRRKGAAA